MSFASLWTDLQRGLAHPVAFLLAVNVLCALLGLAQFGYTLSVFKPTDFAVIGVLSAIGGVVTGLLDVKLADLTTKLYFAVPKDKLESRADLLAASLVLHAAAGLAGTALVFVAASLLASRFLAAPIETWWAVVIAARLGSIYPMAALTTVLRLLGVFRASGWLRLATQAMGAVVTIAALAISPDLTGYFVGAAVVTLLGMIMAFAAVLPQVRRGLGHSLLQAPSRNAIQQFVSAGGFLAAGSLTGIGKLLSRSGDVLVVAALTNDTVTGLYRVARQGYDTIAGLTDAVHQFYTPTIVDCVARQKWSEFRKHRGRLMLIGLVAALGGVVGSWLVLRPLAAAFYPHYGPALPAFEVFAGLLVVTLGIHGWLWPTLVASGRIGWFGVLSLIGALCQLGGIVLLAWLGLLDAASAATAAWIMAAINYGPLLAERLLRRFETQA